MLLEESVVHVMGALAAIAIVSGGTAMAAASRDDRLRSQFEFLSHRSIFFGHQSVGQDLLVGLKELADSAGMSFRVVQVDQPGRIAAGTFAHRSLPENGRPILKLENFTRALSGPGVDVDIAFMKFCYVDFDEKADVHDIFTTYQRTIAVLKREHPTTTFVHVTVPLTTIQRGPKAMVKRIMGRVPAGVAENLRREEYNALLRRAAQEHAEPLFDLARVESTTAEGRRAEYEWSGKVVPELAAAYTSDGGHLNRAGRVRAARELVNVLASAKMARAAY